MTKVHEGQLLRELLKSTDYQMGTIADKLHMSRQNLNHHLRKEEVDRHFLRDLSEILKIDFTKELENRLSTSGVVDERAKSIALIKRMYCRNILWDKYGIPPKYIPKGNYTKEEQNEVKDLTDEEAAEMYEETMREIQAEVEIEHELGNQSMEESEQSESFKDKYIAALENIVGKQEALLKEVRASLEQSEKRFSALERRLTEVGKAASEAKRNQEIMYAYQTAYFQYWIDTLPNSEDVQKKVIEKAAEALGLIQKEGIRL